MPKAYKDSARTMSIGTSLYLDLVRFSAALIVFIEHFRELSSISLKFHRLHIIRKERANLLELLQLQEGVFPNQRIDRLGHTVIQSCEVLSVKLLSESGLVPIFWSGSCAVGNAMCHSATESTEKGEEFGFERYAAAQAAGSGAQSA